MKKILFALISVIAVNTHAENFYSGNDFMAKSEGIQVTYVVGVVDGFLATNEVPFCLPKDVTTGQLAAISKKYLTDNPEKRHFTAASNIAVALGKAFPCK